MEPSSNAPTAIDLFCGAGGLTLGLKRAGFNVLVGLERYPEIAKTYTANHPEVKLITDDIRNISGKEILQIANMNKIDLIAGCPPCQGFTSLTEKNGRRDKRNNLVLQMARIIKEIEPNMVLMENVPGIATRGSYFLSRFNNTLRASGYFINSDILQLANYGIPQSRRRFVLSAGKGFYIPLPEQTHYKIKKSTNIKQRWLTLKDALPKLGRTKSFIEVKKSEKLQKFKWHVVRTLKPVSLRRLEAIRPGQNRRTIPNDLRPKCHENRNSGFSNVYGRMCWNKTPPTITTGCTTPSKGRFSHPTAKRAISIREAACIQTFPVDYILDTNKIEVACQLVGNALPPAFAEIMGHSCLNAKFEKVGGFGDK